MFNNFLNREKDTFFTLEDTENVKKGILVLESEYFEIIKIILEEDLDEREREYEIEEQLENHLHEGEEEHMHTHVLEDGTTVMHSHGEHGHHHSHAQTKAVLNRLSRAIGHLESIKRMVEDGRDCSEVLIQLSAVKSAINNTGKIILQDHIEHCIVDAVEHGDKDAIKELERAIDRFMK